MPSFAVSSALALFLRPNGLLQALNIRRVYTFALRQGDTEQRKS